MGVALQLGVLVSLHEEAGRLSGQGARQFLNWPNVNGNMSSILILVAMPSTIP